MTSVMLLVCMMTYPFTQGALDKVVVVIKNKEEVALERFIFAIDSLIPVAPFNRDTRSVT